MYIQDHFQKMKLTFFGQIQPLDPNSTAQYKFKKNFMHPKRMAWNTYLYFALKDS